MSSQPSTIVTIDFQFDDAYWESVDAKRSPDRWIQTSIRVNDTYIYGDEESGVRGVACGVVLQLLESAEAVLADSNYIIEFEYGPTWLALETSDSDSVNVVKCTTLAGAEDPDKRLSIDTSRPATKEAWMKAVVEAAEDFHTTVLDKNPEFSDNSAMVRIAERIDHVRNLTSEI